MASVKTGRLTKRQLEVLAWAAYGLGNTEIGQELGITEQTVKFHFIRIRAMLGASNRPSAVHRAMLLGYVLDPAAPTLRLKPERRIIQPDPDDPLETKGYPVISSPYRDWSTTPAASQPLPSSATPRPQPKTPTAAPRRIQPGATAAFLRAAS